MSKGRSSPRSAPRSGAARGGSARYVALLRGINVGGRTLPMPALVGLFEEAGCTDVSTYIQSGNVVFSWSGPLGGLASDLARAIRKHAGFDAPVVLRSEGELAAILANAPFRDPRGDKPALHVVFLAEEPSAAQIASLDPARSPGDSFAVRGKDVYLLCPNGLGRTKLTNAYFDSKLGTTSTCRNFRTVETLLAMCAGRGAEVTTGPIAPRRR
jgi:uncharacterized protein (DUF1697 family)